MRKFIIAAALLTPVVAFAETPLSAAGGANLSKTSAFSNAGVQSTQGTGAMIRAAGTGGVVVGSMAGNYTAVDTTAFGKAGPAGSYTNTTASQTNLGGTVAGGLSFNKAGQSFPVALGGVSSGMSGSAGGSQNTQATGGSSAAATNMNVGRFMRTTSPR